MQATVISSDSRTSTRWPSPACDTPAEMNRVPLTAMVLVMMCPGYASAASGARPASSAAMARPAHCPCSAAVFQMPSTRFSPETSSSACAASPAANTSGALVRMKSSTTMARSISIDPSCMKPKSERTPCATTIWS